MKDSKQSKVSFTQNISIVFILTMLLLGCSTVKTVSQSNVELIQPSHIQTNPGQSSQNRIINEKGWQSPPSRHRRKIKTTVSNRISEDGNNINVTSSYYTQNEKFIYSEKIKSFDEDFELQTYIENKVKNKIFWYTIFARKVPVNTKQTVNSSHNHPFVYGIIDTDGDGIFETKVIDGSEILVPNWAAK